MATGVATRRNQYYDSVFLMGVNRRLLDSAGVRQSAVLMGSEANKSLLADLGIEDVQVQHARPNDLVAAVIADSTQAAEAALAQLDDFLAGGQPAGASPNPRTLEEGLRLKPAGNLAVISIPGEYAAAEVEKALTAGLHVFLFSSNVPVEDELRLKRLAGEKGLLLMGPDCGTAILGGVGLGFSNAVRRGPIGVVAAAGTGLQEFTSQVHAAGSGISHAIGTGGRDLSDAIGGLTAVAGLEALDRDAQTRVVAVISKPPGPKALDRLLERIRSTRKPVIGCFLGAGRELVKAKGNLQIASTIDEAVRVSLGEVGRPVEQDELGPGDTEEERVRQEARRWSKTQRYVRGLFAGGTFCYQSQQILREAGLHAHSNAPLEPRLKLGDSNRSEQHTLVDMGSEEYTLARPHPMIDGTLRRQRILQEGGDPETAVLLLDFVLGYNASADPVGDLLDGIRQAVQGARAGGRTLTVVASICGTREDPQDLEAQRRLLREAGVCVFQSSARAAAFCASLVNAAGG